MKKEIIKGYKVDNFILDDLFVFTKNHYSFLLNKNGCSIIVNDSLLKDIKNKNLDEDLRIKLLSHALGKLSNKDFINKKEDNNIYFIIDVTKKCNFDCIYCFRNLNDNRMIEDNKLEDICKYILKVSNERKLSNINLQVWGGEPIFGIKKLEYIYNFFKDTNVKVRIDIETNGSLITDKLAKRLHDMNVSIGVSIDGTPKHQNYQRKLIGDKPSMDLVRKGIKNLQKYYKEDIGGITVVTKHNYKDIGEIIDFYTKELNIHNMKFNLVKDNPNADEKGIGLNKEEIIKFTNNLFDAVNLYNLLGVTLIEGNIQTRINNLLQRDSYSYCTSNGCKGGKNLISFDMNGNIYPCEMTDYSEVKLGSIYSDKSLEEQLKESTKTNPYFMDKETEECKECPWDYYCKGGCRSRILYSKGKMKYDETECIFNKIMYERIIENILDNIK